MFVEFDVHKQLVTKCKKKKSIVGNGKLCTSFVYDHQFHVIGGTEKDRHLIWDTMQQKFDEFVMPQPSPAGHSSILLSNSDNKKNNDYDNPRIIVFGGNESIKFSKYLDSILIGDLHPEITWKKLKNYHMPYKQYFFGCIVYKQLYVIIFGGKQKDTNAKTNSGLSDEIWIMTLKTFKWSRCHMKCPKKAKYIIYISSYSK